MTRDMSNIVENKVLAKSFEDFESFLHDRNLPVDGIVAGPEERFRVMTAIPDFIDSLPIEVRKDARYLSKFIAGAAVGLFDASLNFVWNEVVVNLRKKAIAYGLDLFYDEAVGGKNRVDYNTEEDLPGLKDRTLLDTCLKLELLPELVYKKLVHILEMRNDIGSSHPNHYSINSYELLGWLQTCVQDVLTAEVSKSAITIQQIVANVRKSTEVFDRTIIVQFAESLKDVSKVLVSNLLATLFSMYVSKDVNSTIKNNILSLAPYVWKESTDSKKYDLGLRVDFYKANLDVEKNSAAEEFFEICDGKRYLSLNERTVQLDSLCDSLRRAHYGWDNYFNEVPFAREIMSYIKKSEDIPKEREEKLIETIVICRLGRNVAYCNGVSPNGKPYYDNFLELLTRTHVIILLQILMKPEVCSNFDGEIISSNLREILQMIKKPTLGERLNEIVDFMLKQERTSNLRMNKEFGELAKGILI